MVGMYLKSNEISKQRIYLLRENEVIVELIAVEVVQASLGSDAYVIKIDE